MESAAVGEGQSSWVSELGGRETTWGFRVAGGDCTFSPVGSSSPMRNHCRILNLPMHRQPNVLPDPNRP